MPNLQSPVTSLSKIGQALSKRLLRLGIKTIEDLIWHLPHRYDNFAVSNTIASITQPGQYTVEGVIELINMRRAFRRNMTIIEAVLADKTGAIKITWFNQPYLLKQLPVGTSIKVAGKVSNKYGGLGFSSPQYEISSGEVVHTGETVPIYPVTENLTQKQIRVMILQALKYLPQIEDKLPVAIIKKRQLIDLQTALENIHHPGSATQLKAAEKRIKYNELFSLLMRMKQLRAMSEQDLSPALIFKEDEIKQFVKTLPFELTDDQKKISWKILQDIQATKPMNRLVQGDVGSGKTVVAAIAMLNASKNKFQTALMAPTEVLAKQHFLAFIEFFKDFEQPLLYLSSAFKQFYYKGQLNEIKTKEVQDLINSYPNLMIIGTHSLIQDSIEYLPLSLVVVDEQHRFGVAQRGKLRRKILNKYKIMPHYLCLTATPIPRSLALTLYGDLDISALRQKPKGRKNVITQVVTKNQYKIKYDFIKTEIKKGRQVFIICPLIDPSDKLEVASVKQTYDNLTETVFKDYKVALLHGKMKSKEKDTVMSSFKNKKYDVLISTTVIEVGVDIPNATIIIVEGAERFGLSQLHQLRGRVGRSADQAYCYLFTTIDSQTEKKRLRILETIYDGFVLSEKDLEIRGPGELYGIRQSGSVNLQLASLVDYELIEDVKEDVNETAIKDCGFGDGEVYLD